MRFPKQNKQALAIIRKPRLIPTRARDSRLRRGRGEHISTQRSVPINVTQLIQLLDVLVDLSQQPDPHLGVLGGGAERGVLAEPGGEGLHDAGDGGAEGEEDFGVLGVADGLGEGDAELGDESCREMVGGGREGGEEGLEVAPVLVQVADGVVHEVLVADARAAVVHEDVGADVVD